MKKRILSSLLAFVLLLSALPMGVYAAETRYSVAASPDQTTDVGKTVSMSVSVSGGKYNAYDLVLTYDTVRLTYVSGQAADKGASVTEKSGSIRVIGYGADKSASTKVVTLTFKTKAAGTAKVVISSAKIDTGTNAPTKNAPPAAISRNTTKFTIQPGYTVTLDEGLASDSLSAAAGEDYTFRATDPLHYDYKPSAKIGGKDVTVKDNGDGTYTIPGSEINGNITVKANRTPKTYKVTFKGEDLSGEKTAAYNTPYHFKLNRKAGYSYVLRVTIGGKSYTGYKAENGGYVIPGADITGDIALPSMCRSALSVPARTTRWAGKPHGAVRIIHSALIVRTIPIMTFPQGSTALPSNVPTTVKRIFTVFRAARSREISPSRLRRAPRWRSTYTSRWISRACTL